MFKEERLEKIMDKINEEGRVNTAWIQRVFGVGYGTAQSDLDELSAKGMVQRTHGGAIRNRQIGYTIYGIGELSAKEKCADIKENYLAIAKKAVSLIEQNDVVYLTHASLGYLMAREMPEGMNITAVTNSLSIAEELRGKSGVRTILAGGCMEQNGNFYDSFAEDMLKKIKFDKAFLTSAAFTAGFGMSLQGSRSISITNTVISGSRKVIGMYPAEKLGCDSVMQICPASSVDILITESEANDEECSALEQLGMQIIKV